MGYFGYKFISLTPLEVADRRVQLDLHAFIAQASLGLILLFIQLVRLLDWTLRRYVIGDFESRPSSPQKKYVAENRGRRWLRKAAHKARVARWWMGEDVELPLLGGKFGVKWQWVGGLIWAGWLAVLCVHGTRPGEF
jgi:hypothetical protein